MKCLFFLNCFILLFLFSCRKTTNNNNTPQGIFTLKANVLTQDVSINDTAKYNVNITSNYKSPASYVYTIPNKDTIYDYVKNKVYYGPANDTLAINTLNNNLTFNFGLIAKTINPNRIVNINIENYNNRVNESTEVSFNIDIPFVKINAIISTTTFSIIDTGNFTISIKKNYLSPASYVYIINKGDTIYDYLKNKEYDGPTTDTLTMNTLTDSVGFNFGFITKVPSASRTVNAIVMDYKNNITSNTQALNFNIINPAITINLKNNNTSVITTLDTAKFSVSLSKNYLSPVAWLYQIESGDTIYDYLKNKEYDGPTIDTLSTTNASISNYPLGLISNIVNSNRNVIIKIKDYNNQITNSTDIQFSIISPTIALAVGTNGVILKTVNGGDTWRIVNSPSTNTLNSISFFSTNGVIAGNDATLLYTKDNGNTWVQNNTLPTSTSTGNLLSATYYSNSTAFVVGRVGTFPDMSYKPILIKTTDTANTWTNTSSSPLLLVQSAPGTITSISSSLIVIGSERIQLYTTDQFNTLNQQFINVGGIPYTGRYNITSVSLFTPTSGIAVGYSTIFGETQTSAIIRVNIGIRTNWAFISSIPSTQAFNGVAVASANNVATVGNGGVIAYSTDGGSTWAAANSGTTLNLSSIAFSSATNGIAVGANGTILQTTDGGQSWISVQSPTTENLNSVTFLSNK